MLVALHIHYHRRVSCQWSGQQKLPSLRRKISHSNSFNTLRSLLANLSAGQEVSVHYYTTTNNSVLIVQLDLNTSMLSKYRWMSQYFVKWKEMQVQRILTL